MKDTRPFVIRHTEGSGVRRDWTYLQPDGSWAVRSTTAAQFSKREYAYAFARQILGAEWMSARNAGVRA